MLPRVSRLAQLSRHLSTAAAAAPPSSTAKMGRPTDITLYTDATPNGIKVSILLAELDLDYKLERVDITTNAQKEPWFLEINPNGRIPALTDTFTDGSLLLLLFLLILCIVQLQLQLPQ
jgi:hypothetical protein